MKNYHIFSKFYDSVMGDRKLEAKKIRTIISDYHPTAKTVLELACGTGSVISHLSKKGFDVSGVDISRSMLKIAKNKNPRAKLFCRDMVNFKTSRKFDVVLCVYDSINHLLFSREWEKTIKNAYSHLNRNGIFIFDVNTENKLKYLNGSKPSVIKFGNNRIEIDVRQKKGSIYNWNIKIFERKKGGEYKCHIENINEKSFPLSTINRLVKKIFRNFKVLDLENNKVSSKSQRLYFICFRD